MCSLFVGCSFVTFQRAGTASGDTPIGVILVATALNVLVLGTVATSRRPMPAVPRRTGIAAIAVGLGDTAANILYMHASGAGSAAVTASVGATFPVVTALLAFALLGDRLAARRLVGVAAVVVALPCSPADHGRPP